MLPGLPLLIIGSTSTDEDRLAMLIPGAIMMSVGGFALLMWILQSSGWGQQRALVRGENGSRK